MSQGALGRVTDRAFGLLVLGNLLEDRRRGPVAGGSDEVDQFELHLLPQGLDVNYEVDGLDFEVSLELEPDDTTSTLGLYLADGPDLLAWGRSAPFVLSNPTADFAVYLSPPGALSTFPGAIGDPDPEMFASPAIGRGMLLLDGDGQTGLFNVFTLDTEIGATLKDPAGLPDPADGALVPDSRGNVWRVAWAEQLRAHRYAPGDDAWSAPTLTGAAAGARPGAAHLQDASLERVLLFGGGEQRSVLELGLVPDDDGAQVVTVLPGELDSPRRGATAAYLVRSDGDAGEGVVLVGGDDPKAALVFHLGEDFASGGGKAVGELGAWTGTRCMQVDRGEAAERNDYVRMLCVGGVQGGEATTDAIVLNFPPAAADSTPSVQILPGFLPEPAADPRLFADDAAIYAQSGALWLRIDRAELAVEALTGPSPRVRGGHSVLLATGATFLVGGWAADEQPVDHWHVFAPSLSALSAP